MKYKNIDKCKNRWKTNYWISLKPKKWKKKKYYKKSKPKKRTESKNKPNKSYKKLIQFYYKECSRFLFYRNKLDR